jgi:hypothetical protein
MRVLLSLALTAGVVATGLSAATAADISKFTAAILKELGKPASLLDGLERELAVPKAWIEGARMEGALVVSGTWDEGQFRKMTGPFHRTLSVHPHQAASRQPPGTGDQAAHGASVGASDHGCDRRYRLALRHVRAG